MLPQPPPTSLATPLSPRNMPLPTAAMFPNVGSGVNLAEAHAMSLPMCLPRTPRRESRVSASNFLNTTNANNNSNSNNSTPGMDGWRLAPRPRVNPASTTTASPRRMIVPRRGQQASSLLAGWSRSAAPNNNINAEVMMMMDGAKQGGLPWLEESVGLSTNGSPVMASPLPVSSGVVGVGGSGGGWANSRRESMALLTRPVLSQLRFSPRRHRSMGDGVAEAMTEDEDDLVAYGSLAANSSCCTLEEEENHSVPDFISFPMVDDLHCEEVPSGDASPIPIHTPRWRYRNPQRSVDVEGSGVHHVRDGSELRRATGMMVLQPSDSNYVIEAASLVRAPPHRGLHEVVGLATHQRSKSCVSFTNLTAASMHSTGADSASDGTFVPIAVASITSTGDWQALLPRAARQHMRHSSCGSDEGLHYSTTRAKSCN